LFFISYYPLVELRVYWWNKSEQLQEVFIFGKFNAWPLFIKVSCRGVLPLHPGFLKSVMWKSMALRIL
jgi:hypothetical protein